MPTATAPETSAALDLDREEQEWRNIEQGHTRSPYTGMLYAQGPHYGPKVSNRPHPDSYGSDRPLWANKDAGITTLSAAEKKELRARQIPLVLYPETSREDLEKIVKGPTGKTFSDTRRQYDAARRRLAALGGVEKCRAKVRELATSVGFLLA